MVVKVSHEQADWVPADRSDVAGYLEPVGCLELVDWSEPPAVQVVGLSWRIQLVLAHYWEPAGDLNWEICLALC